MNVRRSALVRLLALLLAALPAGAQWSLAQPSPRFRMDVQGVPLADALRTAAQVSGVALSYEPALVASKSATCRIQTDGVEALFGCVLRGSGLALARQDGPAYTLVARPDNTLSVGPLTARTASIAGVAVDEVSGQSVEDAVLTLLPSGRTLRSGRFFVFASLAPGAYRIRASHVGFEPLEVQLEVSSGDERTLRLRLRPRATELPQVVVDGLSVARPYVTLGTDQRPAEAASSTGEQASAPTLGVSPLADYRVQGWGEGDYLLTLDGARTFPVPSLLGVVGPLGPLAIGQITAQKAAYGSLAGSSVVGLVDATHYLPDQPEVTARIDPFVAEVRAGGRLAAGTSSRAMVSVHANLPIEREAGALANALSARVQPDPLLSRLVGPDTAAYLSIGQPRSGAAHFDAHAAAHYQGAGVSAVSVSGHYGSRRLLTRYPDDPLGDRDEQGWQTYNGHVLWLTDLGSATLLRLRGSLAGYEHEAVGQIGGAAAPAVLRTLNQASHASLDARIDFALGEDIRSEAGLTYERISTRLAAPTLASKTFDHAARSARVAAFGSLRLSPAPIVEAELGLRVVYAALQQRVYPDPHVTLRFGQARSPVGPWAARVGFGTFHQYMLATHTPSYSPASPFGSDVVWTVLDTSLNVPSAEHLAAEMRVEPFPWLALQADSYYRIQRSSPTLVPPDTASGTLVSADFLRFEQATGFGFGVLVDVRYHAFAAQARYGYHRTKTAHPFAPDAPQNPPGSRPHYGTLATTLRLTRRVEALARLNVATFDGWAYRLAYYAAADALQRGTLPPDRADALRPLVDAYALDTPEATLPATVRLDVGLGYRRTFGPLAAVAHLEVYNALDRLNPDERSLTAGGIAERPTLPITLAASLRVTWQAPEPEP